MEYCYGRRDEKEIEFFNRDNYYYPLKQNFLAIPGQPITYSFSEEIINAFQNEPSVVDRGTTRLGMTTADNNKFLRLWYEVDINKEIFDAKSDEEVQSKNKKWVPYNKGGKYRKWYGNHDCVVNWENSGFEIKNFADDKGHIRSTVPNTEYYFLPCATWSKISSGSIAFRYRPVGSIFDVAGACLYSNRGLYQLMGFLNSNVANSILSILSPTLNYEGSHIASLPIKDQMIENSRIEALVKRNIVLSKEDWDSFEFSWDFQRHPLAHGSLISDAYNEWEKTCDARFFEMKANEEELNRIPNISQANRLKRMSQQKCLDMDKIYEILQEIKSNQKEQIKLPLERIGKYFPTAYTPKQQVDLIEKLLKNWAKQNVK